MAFVTPSGVECQLHLEAVSVNAHSRLRRLELRPPSSGYGVLAPVRPRPSILNECRGHSTTTAVGALSAAFAVVFSAGFLGVLPSLERSAEAVTCFMAQAVGLPAECDAAYSESSPSLALPARDEVAYPLERTSAVPREVWARADANELPLRFVVPDHKTRDEYKAQLAELGYHEVEDEGVIAAARVHDSSASYASEDSKPMVGELSKVLASYGTVQLANAEDPESAVSASELPEFQSIYPEEWRDDVRAVARSGCARVSGGRGGRGARFMA